MSNTYLKLKDETLLEFNLDDGMCQIYNPDMLPFRLRDSLKNVQMLDSTEALQNSRKNYEALIDYFGSRSLNVKRENAKKILNALHISQSNAFSAKLKTMVLCKALSVTDDYWITNNKDEKWESVNLKTNKLNEAISQIALSGISLTITGEIHTPELTGQGAYAKAWFREGDGLYLYKASTKGGCESEKEVYISNILDYTNVPHVKYEGFVQNDRYICKCKNISSDKYAIISAEDVICWCNRNAISFDQLVKKLDAENYYKTIVVDYLISNSDRHDQNWGFYMDNDTGELIGLHPIFDHNNAFDNGDMESISGGDSLMMLGKTKQEAAKYAINRCSFKIKSVFPEKFFPDNRSFMSFTTRAMELGIYQFIDNKLVVNPKYSLESKKRQDEIEMER